MHMFLSWLFLQHFYQLMVMTNLRLIPPAEPFPLVRINAASAHNQTNRHLQASSQDLIML